MNTNDPAPLAALLTLGATAIGTPADWPDYPQQFGLGVQDVPALIDLATNEDLRFSEDETPAVWGPVHAWRALGQLGATGASLPLLRVFAWDDPWAFEELPQVFALLGATTLPDLAAYLLDGQQPGDARVSAIDSLERIAARQPEAFGPCQAIFADALARHLTNPPELNACLVSAIAA